MHGARTVAASLLELRAVLHIPPPHSVLLKNEGGVLPLSPTKKIKLGVVGDANNVREKTHDFPYAALVSDGASSHVASH